MKRNIMLNKFIMIMVVTLLTVGILIAPLMAFADEVKPLGIPTEIDARPSTQVIYEGNPASWIVYLSGGTSGLYYITVSYGNGSESYTSSGTHWKHRYYTFGTYNQTWRASRAGGGTDYDYTKVYCYP
jgi:hypothetical protein